MSANEGHQDGITALPSAPLGAPTGPLCACGHPVAIHSDALGVDDPAQCGIEGCECYHIRPIAGAPTPPTPSGIGEFKKLLDEHEEWNSTGTRRPPRAGA